MINRVADIFFNFRFIVPSGAIGAIGVGFLFIVGGGLSERVVSGG